MTEYEFAMRLKNLITHENKLCLRETTIAKNLSKYNQQLSKVQAKMFQQLEDMMEFHYKVIELKEDNQKLSKFIQEQQMELQKGRNDLEKLQEKTEAKKANIIQERQAILLEMNILRCFKTCTQTFINTERLPETIQGVVVCEKENTSQFIPFKIDPLKYTHEEVKDMLWQLIDHPGSINKHWNRLIIGSLNMLPPQEDISAMEF